MLAAATALAAALSVACYEFTGPEPAPNLFLSGSFYRDLTNVPGGGAADTMTLSAIYGHITGYGVQYDLGRFYSTFSVTGQYSDTTQSFVLWIRYAKSGLTTDVTGSVYGADSLSVRVPTYTSPGYYYEVFNRLPVPPCADSAPLEGTYDPAAPGFLVELQDTVNATAEAARLGALYGFTATSVWEAGPKGFAADIPLTTATVLRCEPKVTLIEYNGILTTQ